MKLYAPSTISDIRKKYGFRLSRSLGQNFLADKPIIDRIIAAAGIGASDLVVEIGPGIGVLTAEAARLAGRVAAVEIDEALLPILDETLAGYDNVTVIHADVLKTDMTAIIQENRLSGGVKIIGNLPYYITTPIMMKLLTERVPADSLTIMMQKEVADRIVAAPGSRTYGALSVAVQYYCRVTPVIRVPREVFVPQPKVDSAVLRLDLRKTYPVEVVDEALFFQCVRSGFAKRRKTLLNSLTGTGGCTKEEIGRILAAAEIDPARRAETLDLQEFARIANAMAGRQE